MNITDMTVDEALCWIKTREGSTVAETAKKKLRDEPERFVGASNHVGLNQLRELCDEAWFETVEVAEIIDFPLGEFSSLDFESRSADSVFNWIERRYGRIPCLAAKMVLARFPRMFVDQENPGCIHAPLELRDQAVHIFYDNSIAPTFWGIYFRWYL